MMAAYMCQWLGTSAPPIGSTVCLNVFILQLDDNEISVLIENVYLELEALFLRAE